MSISSNRYGGTIFSEWEVLKEVVVGSAYSKSFLKNFTDNEFVEGMSKILEETEEDLQSLQNLLEQHGVLVRRPAQADLEKQIGPGWVSEYPYPPICPRDFHFVYNKMIINTIGGDCNRYHESDYFNSIMQFKHMAEDRDYYFMPRPILDSQYKSYHEYEPQLMWHSANMLKCGDTILHTRPYDNNNGKGTYSGLNWMKRTLPEGVKYIEIPAVGHADGKLALLKPGLMLCWDPKHIPNEMHKWDYIQVPTSKKDEQLEQLQLSPFYKNSVKQWLNHWIGFVDETCFDINVLSIDPNTVITNGYNKEVDEQLSKHNIKMIPFNFRHKYFWDSGLHCITLDLTREGSLETYV